MNSQNDEERGSPPSGRPRRQRGRAVVDTGVPGGPGQREAGPTRGRARTRDRAPVAGGAPATTSNPPRPGAGGSRAGARHDKNRNALRSRSPARGERERNQRSAFAGVWSSTPTDNAAPLREHPRSRIRATVNAVDVADTANPETPGPTQAKTEAGLAAHAGAARRKRSSRREHRPSVRAQARLNRRRDQKREDA